ncbi:hypothetical protein [Archangium violaceum]|uniref:hypothetical protein n=1 Tax=Archangium violaceum TaxID=83451 RepID=UPI0036DD38D7
MSAIAAKTLSARLSISCGIIRRPDAGPGIQLTFRNGDVINKQIIFNLPVKDLDKSKAFFSSLGFSSNPQIQQRERGIHGHRGWQHS